MDLVLHVHKIEKITLGEERKHMERSHPNTYKPGRGNHGNGDLGLPCSVVSPSQLRASP